MNKKTSIALMAPLSIYVVWHPDYVEGAAFANFFYKSFCRDAEKPITRGLGINVFYRSKNLDPSTKIPPIPIVFDESLNNVVIVLIDDLMVIGEGWEKYVSDLWEHCKGDETCLFLPIAISNHAYNLSQSVSFANFIKSPKQTNLEESTSSLFEKKAVHFTNSIAHEICRMLLHNEDKWQDASKAEKKESALIDLSPSPVKLFISHAKADGEELAIKIRDYLNSGSAIKTFFDAVDIAPGYDFTMEIGGSIQRSALLVVLTDAYATREWCKKEVIKAKSINQSIIVVNALEEGEPRSFPYLGNSPTLRWDEGRMEEVVNVALLEILGQMYEEMHLNGIVSSIKNKLVDDAIVIWPNQPELFSFIAIVKKFEQLKKSNQKNRSGKKSNKPTRKGKNILLYPDPPLGEDEKDIIKGLISDISLETPSSISTLYS